jgi:hypothetical protein
MWHRVKVSDPLARSMRDRHYSTRNPGGRTVGPPGRRLVLVSDDEHALWITHWPDPKLVLDRIDALRCTLFRREGRRRERASVLILAAMATSEAYFGTAPAGWLTYVEPSKIRSQDPGFCFKMAGYELDPTFSNKRLIRLRRGALETNADPLPAEKQGVCDGEPTSGSGKPGRRSVYRNLELPFDFA